MQPVTICWRRLDTPGHESARLRLERGEWHLDGAAVFLHEGTPCRLDYQVVCDAAWHTLSGRVTGWVAGEVVGIQVSADAGGWRVDGRACPAVAGCVDIDLGFSPSTNTLPIRRLGLAVGQAAPVRAAWLRFPGLALEPLDQVYRRDAADRYHYESAGGSFAADLEVSGAGLVTRYPGLWEMEAGFPWP